MDPKTLLSENNLSVTQNRKSILKELIDSRVALSEREIRDNLGTEYDRVTIYRTLKTFEKKDIVHAIITDDNVTKYVIQKENDNHLHFRCIKCDKLFCLTQIKIRSYKLPKGYIEYNRNFLISGLCDKCAANEKS